MASSIVLENLISNDICSISRGRALIVLAWRAQPTVTGIAPLVHALVAAVKGNAPGTLICALADSDMPMPDADAREALQTGIQRLGHLRGAVNVVFGTGFRAAAMRGMLSGFSMVVRQRYPLSFVATETEAASFIVANWPESDSPAPSRGDVARVLTDVKPSYSARKTA